MSQANDTPPSRVSPARNWLFTWNNPPDDYKQRLVDGFADCNINTYIFQKELSPSGTPHIQGAFQCGKGRKVRPLSLNLPSGIHWISMRGSWEDNVVYCSKLESRIDPPTLMGCILPREIQCLKQEQLYPWQVKLENYLLTEPHQRHIVWIWENEGNTGKSAFLKYMAIMHKTVLRGSSGKASDLINLAFNCDWDRKNALVIDLPRSYDGKLAFQAIEDIKNGYVTNLKYETGEKIFNPPHIVIFANAPPIDLTMVSSDRWIIRKIKDLDIININEGQIDTELLYNYILS